MRAIVNVAKPPKAEAIMRCPLCFSAAVAPIFGDSVWRITENGRYFSYLRCSSCRSIYCDPPPTSNEINSYYASQFNYGWYERRRHLKRMQGSHRWAIVRATIEKYAGEIRTLFDVGCGHGWFLRAARKSGWRVGGLELSESAVQFARNSLSLTVQQLPIEQPPPDLKRFGVVTMWHSLEHMLDPVDALRSAARYLENDGVLLIAVPNVDAVGLSVAQAAWVWLQQPFVHLWHFSSTSLATCCEQAGLEVLQITSRDTWDAQSTFDTWATRTQSSRVARKIRHSLMPVGGASGESGCRGRASFVICESARLLAYAHSRLQLRLTGRGDPFKAGRADGSELLLIARLRGVHGA